MEIILTRLVNNTLPIAIFILSPTWFISGGFFSKQIIFYLHSIASAILLA